MLFARLVFHTPPLPASARFCFLFLERGEDGGVSYSFRLLRDYLRRHYCRLIPASVAAYIPVASHPAVRPSAANALTFAISATIRTTA